MNNAEYIELLAAGDWAGYIVATVNFRLAAAEVEWLLGDATPRVLVFEAQYAALVDTLRPRLATVEAYVCIGGPAPGWANDYEAVVEQGSPKGRRSARRHRTTGRWSIPAALPAGPRARCARSGAGCAPPMPARA